MGESILIKKARFVICDETKIIENGAVYVKDGKIADVGKSEQIERKHKGDIVIDATKKAVIPGLIDTHAHVGQTYVRGLIDDLPGEGIFEILAKKIWFGYEYHSAESLRIMELVGKLEMIKNGTTTHLDCQIFPESMATAARDSGLRVILCPQVLDNRKLPDAKNPREYLRMTERTIRKWHGFEDGRINVRVHPHAPYSCEPDYFEKCVEIAKKQNVGIGIHLADGFDEQEFMKKKYGMRSTEFLHNLGVLGPKTICFHCIWINDKEIKILKLTNTKVNHNPYSNAKYALGIARIPEMMEKGITVGLGTDGPQNVPLDMWEAMKFAAAIHKVDKLDPSLMPASKVFSMATLEGAKALLLDKYIGSLDIGKKADVVILDLDDPRFFPLRRENILPMVVSWVHAGHVDTVMVDGKILMEGREIKVLDEAKIMEEAEPIGDKFVLESTKRL